MKMEISRLTSTAALSLSFLVQGTEEELFLRRVRSRDAAFQTPDTVVDDTFSLPIKAEIVVLENPAAVKQKAGNHLPSTTGTQREDAT